jgi:hypothetical protein
MVFQERVRKKMAPDAVVRFFPIGGDGKRLIVSNTGIANT